MFNLKKILSSILAVIMTTALCTVPSAMAGDTDKVMFMDFTDTTVETLPMTNPSASNAGGRIDKNTTVCYGNAEQSGVWAVTGTKSSLDPYLVSDAGLDLAKVAECNVFVMRFYSESDNDVFNAVFNYHDDVKADGYYAKKIYVTKSGWQEVVISVPEIASKLKDEDISNLYCFSMNKGGWGTAGLFDTENDLYFDSMWFENRKSNVVVDADDASLSLTGSNNKNKVSTSTDVVYSDSSSSICWYNTATGGSANSVNLEDISLDTPEYETLTFRMYSEAVDAVNLLLYYTNTEGTAGKYVRETYEFTEEAGNIGKWVEVTLDLTCIDTKDVNVLEDAQKLEKVALNRGSWSITSALNSNLYVDKIWFGDVEDISASFEYKESAYEDASDVGVFDTITLEFEEYLSDTIACDAVTVKHNGNDVTEFDAWSDGKILYVKTDTAMAFDATYEITVTPALKDQRGYSLYGKHTISFHTKLPYLDTDEVKIVDSKGDVISEIPAAGTEITAKAEIINGSNKDENFVIILTMYDINGNLVGVKLNDAAESEYVANMVVSRAIEATDKVAEGAVSIRAFLWNGFDTMIPYGASEI